MKKYLRLISFSLIMVMTLSVVSCGKKEEEVKGKYTSSEVMEKVVVAITDLPEMTTVKSGDDNAKDIFTYLSGIDYDKVSDFEYRYAKEGGAEEIAVVRMKGTSDMKTVKEDLEKRLADRKNNFEIYNEEEVPKFDGATVVVKDNYALLIIGNQAQNGKYEFDKLFK